MTWASDITAAMRATLPPAVGTLPTTGLGYGRDAWCTGSELDDDAREVDPQSPLGIAQTLVRAYLSPRDSVPDAVGRGWDVRQCLNRGVTQTQLRAYEGMMQGEAEQDDRVQSATVSVAIEGSLAVPQLRGRFHIVPQDPALSPFDFVFTVPATGAAMLELLTR